MIEDGPVVEERVVRLVSEGAPLFEWRCTPNHLDALVLGRLFSEGLIEDAGLAAGLRIIDEGPDIVVVLAAPLAMLRHKRVRASTPSIPTADEFAEMFKAMFTAVDARYEEGGIHAAALVRAGRIVVQAEDVGRHNAVDKTIGLALLAGIALPEHGMLVTSRVSGEIARKAAQSTVAWLASRSIPTTLAVSIAQSADMPIVGRAASKTSSIYR